MTFYLTAAGHLLDEPYPTREEAEREAERINRGLEKWGSTLRYGVAERREE